MLQVALAHWNQFAAVIGVVLLLAWQFWPALSKVRLPAVKATPSVKGDLDLMLDILQRAKERNAPTAAFSAAVDALVRELTS